MGNLRVKVFGLKHWSNIVESLVVEIAWVWRIPKFASGQVCFDSTEGVASGGNAG